MFSFRQKTAMPSPGEALPGRPDAIPTATRHFVDGALLKGPYPEGAETVMFGLGCFWGAKRKFWQTQGVLVTAVGYAAASPRTPPTPRLARG